MLTAPGTWYEFSLINREAPSTFIRKDRFYEQKGP